MGKQRQHEARQIIICHSFILSDLGLHWQTSIKRCDPVVDPGEKILLISLRAVTIEQTAETHVACESLKGHTGAL